ncbi:MAG TPA: hypothetical protein VFV92_12900, partial [Candidatus Bathyarchaeia archaeon]|nr:hypothetical protein [Candidatus Bathyarchaeia archaeon]
MSAKNLVIHNSRWRSARIAAQVSPSQLVLQNASLVSAIQGEAFLRGSIGLRNWSYLPTNPLSIDLSVQRIRVADLQSMMKLHYPISGELSAGIHLHGSELDPIGSGAVRILNARIHEEPLQNLMLEFRADKGLINSAANISMRSGSATVKLDYAPATKAYKLQLDAPSVVLQELDAVRVRNLPLSGVLKVSAMGQGTLENLQLTAILD